MAAALLLVLFRRNMGGDHNPKQLNNQRRGQHRRLGNAHGARDNLVEASCVSFASVQARKLNHYAASPLPTKPSGFAGSSRRASEKRAVGSLGRLHHAAQPVWTHNVRPARKTGCHALGLKAVETPSTSCESCQALSALFPIAGARAANTAKKSHSDYSSDYKSQKAEIQFFIATIVATTKYTVQRFWNLWLVKNEDQKIPLNGMRIGLRFWLFLLRKKSASIAFWYQNAACRENPDPNAACVRRIDG